MERAVLDPGVLAVALISAPGAPRELLLAWLKGDFDLIVSPTLLGELERVLLRPKFRAYATEEDARAYVALFYRFATIVGDPPVTPGLTPDPNDDYLVALAVASGAHTLVSRDRHLYDLPNPKPPVRKPRAFLEHLTKPT